MGVLQTAPTLPLNEEEELSWVVRCPNDPLSSQAAGKAPGFVVVLVLRFLLLLRLLLLVGSLRFALLPSLLVATLLECQCWKYVS